ncbi:tRNA:m(4)X modification enzyme TRM13 homolog isoform X2 [Narcine bancroftii]|uniref:tRNA:m(4)X modification enzyme TRM13 homolog isoform X2 n=1 Tax=Narcine bancroftii TaxID=1343680 RepID=UPI0038312AC5
MGSEGDGVEAPLPGRVKTSGKEFHVPLIQNIDEDKLEKHLKKCNSREKPKPIYYCKGINGGCEDAVETAKQQVSICTLSKEELEKIIGKLLKTTSSLDSQLIDQTSTHRALEKALNDPKNGEHAFKHLKQKASLAGNLERLGLLGSNRCFVEFGAGRGKLSHWIDLALQDAENVHFLLVERATTRFKVDGKHRRQGSTFERLQIDIEDLNLSNVPLLARENLPVVAIGKHLCGAATDLALRCLLRSYKTENKDPDKEPLEKRLKSDERETIRAHPLNLSNCTLLNTPNGLPIHGVAIAVCCHHRCEWKHYVGKEFFFSQDLTADDFKIFQRLSSWATCGMKRHSIDTSEVEFGSTHPKVEEHSFEEEGSAYEGTMTAEEREHVGRLCKHLIDQGRIWYLQQQGFDSALQYYTSPSISLENVLLTAIPFQQLSSLRTLK